MVEKLLQLLVGVVDAQLLKAVEVENLKASNIQDANEAGSLTLGAVQGSVDPGHDPLEEPLVSGLGESLDGELDLLLGLGLGHEIPTHFDPWLQEALGHLIDIDAEQMGHFLRYRVVRQNGLVRVAFLLELHVAKKQGSTNDSPDGTDFVLTEAHNTHGFNSGQEFFFIIILPVVDRDKASRQECVVLGILKDVFLCKIIL